MVSLGKRVLLRKGLLVVAAVVAIGASAEISSATIVVNGTYSSDYGSAITTQTINTGFGTSSGANDSFNDDGNGSELDAAYGLVQNGNLNLLFTGDFQDNGNHLNIFIADGRVGQFTLNASVGPINNMNGSQFSPDFGNGATYVIDANDYQGTVYTDLDDLTGNSPSGYEGSFAANNGSPNTINNLSNGGVTESLNNSNVSTMGASGTATNQAAADAVTTGFEVAIPVNLLGNPGPGSFFDVFADINGGGDGYLSNQFLPGLSVGTGNLGTSTFNFSSTPGEWFPVGVPEPGSLGMIAMGAIGLLIRRRRKA